MARVGLRAGGEGEVPDDGNLRRRRQEVLRKLERVVDPELGESIVALGLVYGVEVEGGRVAVRMTLTTPGCPLGDALMGGVRRVVQELSWVERVEVRLVWDPPWHPGLIRGGGSSGRSG